MNGGPFRICPPDRYEKALAPGAWSKGRPSVVTQGDRRMTRVTGGNPGGCGDLIPYKPRKLSPSLTVLLCYAFLRFGSAKVKALSGTATL